MAEIVLTPALPLGGLDETIGANRIRERGDLALVAVSVPLGEEEALARAMEVGLGLAPPDAVRSSKAGETRAWRGAPDQILLVFPDDGPRPDLRIEDALRGTGYSVDQTGAFVVLEISGPDCLNALERICPLDLAPKRFPDGAAARTLMEHLGVVLLRLGPEAFWMISASSSAASFHEAVAVSFRNVVAAG